MNKFEKSYLVKSSLKWALALLILLAMVDCIGLTIDCIVINHQEMGKVIGTILTTTWKERVWRIVLYTICGILGILFVVKSLKNAHAIDTSKIRTGKTTILVGITILVVDVCVFMIELITDCIDDFLDMASAILQNPSNVAIIISINLAIILVAVLYYKMGSSGKRGKRESS